MTNETVDTPQELGPGLVEFVFVMTEAEYRMVREGAVLSDLTENDFVRQSISDADFFDDLRRQGGRIRAVRNGKMYREKVVGGSTFRGALRAMVSRNSPSAPALVERAAIVTDHEFSLLQRGAALSGLSDNDYLLGAISDARFRRGKIAEGFSIRVLQGEVLYRVLDTPTR